MAQACFNKIGLEQAKWVARDLRRSSDDIPSVNDIVKLTMIVIVVMVKSMHILFLEILRVTSFYFYHF